MKTRRPRHQFDDGEQVVYLGEPLPSGVVRGDRLTVAGAWLGAGRGFHPCYCCDAANGRQVFVAEADLCELLAWCE